MDAKFANHLEVDSVVLMSLLVLAESCRYLLGGEQGQKVEESIKSAVRGDAGGFRSARLCFDVVATPGTVSQSDVDHLRIEGPDYLSECFQDLEWDDGDSDYGAIGVVCTAILGLRMAAYAQLNVIEFAQDVVRQSLLGDGFRDDELAQLGGEPIGGGRPRRSGEGRESDPELLRDPIDAIEWLAGRPNYSPPPLPVDWVNQHLSTIETLEAAALLPGLVTWLNGSTTENLARSLNWKQVRVRRWVRAVGVCPATAEEIAVATGLDAASYRQLIERLLQSRGAPPADGVALGGRRTN